MINLEKKYLTLIDLVKHQDPHHAKKIAICLHVLSAANRIDKSCGDKLSHYNLSEGRFLILALLIQYDHLSPLEIAHHCGVTKATISALLQSLIKDQFINKALDPQDGRKQIITLTKTGRQLISQLFSIHTKWIEQLTDNFSQGEAEQLTQLLTKLLNNLRDKE